MFFQACGKQVEEQLLAVALQLGLIAVAVQEPSTGEEHFTRITEVLLKRHQHPRTINLYISALNQLGILWAERFEYDKAKQELIKSSQCYETYKKDNLNLPPLPVNSLFLKVKQDVSSAVIKQNEVLTIADEGEPSCGGGSALGKWSDLEQLHTYTLYFLAQVHGHLG